jgi:hypothetical protein
MMQPVSVINLADLIAGVKHERIAGKPLISKKCHIDFKRCGDSEAGGSQSILPCSKSV